MLWVIKRTVSMREFFEHPKLMIKLRNKKVNTILCSVFVFIWTCVRKVTIIDHSYSEFDQEIPQSHTADQPMAHSTFIVTIHL